MTTTNKILKKVSKKREGEERIEINMEGKNIPSN